MLFTNDSRILSEIVRLMLGDHEELVSSCSRRQNCLSSPMDINLVLCIEDYKSISVQPEVLPFLAANTF